ncbi:MAG TPA: hypothetical protein VG099_31445 [Gemmataceae bacterium]|jgi:hypothetical protein|nr:hypothetical protein [Gemmataceae bacterium]
MTPDQQVGLQGAVLRQTAQDPAWLGYWLHSHQEHEGLDAARLAKKLELAMDRYVFLCLCRTPRADHFREDVEAICRRTGVKEIDLLRLLRQEQNLERLGQAGEAPARGWLMAASDRGPEAGEPPPPAEEKGDD